MWGGINDWLGAGGQEGRAKEEDVDDEENDEESDITTSFWSALNMIKEKTSEAAVTVLSDINELGSVIKQDTVLAVEDSKSVLGTWLPALLGGEGEGRKGEGETADKHTEGYKARLHALQNDADTFLVIREEDRDQYGKWEADFHQESYRSHINELLERHFHMRQMLRQLVPLRSTEDLFWCKYLFNVMKYEEREKARAQLFTVTVEGPEADWGDEDIETPVETSSAPPLPPTSNAASLNPLPSPPPLAATAPFPHHLVAAVEVVPSYTATNTSNGTSDVTVAGVGGKEDDIDGLVSDILNDSAEWTKVESDKGASSAAAPTNDEWYDWE